MLDAHSNVLESSGRRCFDKPHGLESSRRLWILIGNVGLECYRKRWIDKNDVRVELGSTGNTKRMFWSAPDPWINEKSGSDRSRRRWGYKNTGLAPGGVGITDILVCKAPVAVG